MAIAALALVSCKKDEVNSTELGEATITGNLWAELDYTNATPEGVSGMQVKVEINTQDWDQQPVPGYNYDKKVYTTTTDASGNYTLTLPATDEGYNVTIEFEDLFTSQTVAGGGTQQVKVTRGDITKFIYSGAQLSTVDQASVTVVNNTVEQYGEMKIYGTVYVDYNVANWNVAPPSNQRMTTASGINEPVVWRYESAPYTNSDQTVYSVAVNLTDGSYELTIPTEVLGGSDVGMDWGIMDFAGTRIQNNQAFNGDSTVSGIWSASGDGIEYFDGYYYQDGDMIANMDIWLNFSPF